VFCIPEASVDCEVGRTVQRMAVDEELQIFRVHHIGR
jgi:hypothetical protein